MNSNLKTTRIVSFSQTGGPEVLKIENVEITMPCPNEVRVSVKAFSLNRADTM